MGAQFEVLTVALLVLMALGPTLDVQADPIILPPSQTYYPRDSILIDDDSRFTVENGVVGGNGTRANPFVIDSWAIVVLGFENPGIRIVDTTAYFRIKHVRLISNDGPVVGDYGIDISGAANGHIIGCLVEGFQSAIHISGSNNMKIEHNNLTSKTLGSTAGIEISQTSDAIVTMNTIVDYNYGISMNHVANATVSRNAIEGPYDGIFIRDSSGVNVSDNTVDTAVYRFYDNDWTRNEWQGTTRVINEDIGRLLLFGVVVPVCAVLAAAVVFAQRRRKTHAAS